MDTPRLMDKAVWRKYLFYVDMLVWGIFAAAVAYVVGNVYLVGFYEGAQDWATHSGFWWRAFVGLSFMVASLSWVFFRFWKNGYKAMRRPF
jgi:hypothetical protein